MNDNILDTALIAWMRMPPQRVDAEESDYALDRMAAAIAAVEPLLEREALTRAAERIATVIEAHGGCEDDSTVTVSHDELLAVVRRVLENDEAR